MYMYVIVIQDSVYAFSFSDIWTRDSSRDISQTTLRSANSSIEPEEISYINHTTGGRSGEVIYVC